MDFFEGIPQQLRSKFEQKRAESDLWFQNTTVSERNAGDIARAMLDHIVCVFCAYTDGLSDLSSSEVRARGDAFLTALIQQELGSKYPNPMSAANLKRNTFQARQIIEMTPEWSTFLEYVRDLAKWESSGNEEPMPKQTSWEEIEITFTSDHQCQINGAAPLNYSDLGLEDRRSGNPSKAWGVLRLIAHNSGQLTLASPEMKMGTRQNTEKRIAELRQVLRAKYSLQEDPLPFIDGVGYQSRFKIHCARSYTAD